ncbi:MAG: hypothetical protein BGN93_12000 [Acinetobacter sp. 39-4]|nr:MAG: hypothetical protein BGN93_12000 [Acinetobacter sp. 39-4]OJU92392.1 MAG: hypothetical protein BGO19_14035 [Acinetobacter sp. 38-8]
MTKFINFDAVLFTDFDSASSNKIPRTVEENISRGRAAMRVVLKTKQDFDHAMYTRELGWIDFIWGETGVVRLNGKTKGGKGIVHIIEARQRKNAMTALEVHALMYRIVTTIARAKPHEKNIVERNGERRLTIESDGLKVILIKEILRNAWLLSGFENQTIV